MPIDRDLILLLWSESEINAGLALLAQAHEACGYDSAILVASDSPKLLMEQVRSRIDKQCPEIKKSCLIDSVESNLNAIKPMLKEDTRLRFLLLPGLDQLNDIHRQLLKELDVSVVCYQTHQNICQPDTKDLLVGKDTDGAIQNFRNLLGLERPLERGTVEDLVQTAKEEGQGSSDLNQEDASGEAVPLEAGHPQANEDATWHFLATNSDQLENQLRVARQLMDSVRGPVLLVRSEKGWSRRAIRSRWLRHVVRHIPQMDRQQRKDLSEQLERESRPSFDFLALICASSFLAAFGLAQDSAAVIIGAMLVAPLMSPILGAGIALAQGNRVLFTQSVKTILLGYVAAISAGAVFGILLQVLPNNVLQRTEDGYLLTNEMWSRTYPGPLDFLVGLVGGLAAAFARTRKELSSALAGAAIAAALVPPIATAGMELALIFQPIKVPDGRSLDNLVLGPSLLFLCNMLTIMIGSSFVLWASGIRSVHDHTSKERWTIRMFALLATATVLVFAWIIQH